MRRFILRDLLDLLPWSGRNREPVDWLEPDVEPQFPSMGAIYQAPPVEAPAPAFPAGVLSMSDGLAALDAEVDRARRYGRSLALLMLDIGFEQSEQPPVRQAYRSSALVAPAWLLASRLRGTDAVAVDPACSRFMLVLPETGPSGAVALAGRLETEIVRMMAVRLAWGVAHFPGSALTPEQLVQRAEADLAYGVGALTAATREVADADVASA
ncbi:MAG: hypothetical protein HY331_07955 [Chloroflexi bacterium]|nr:hypothetical protein [Chloroflexota bacterium]